MSDLSVSALAAKPANHMQASCHNNKVQFQITPLPKVYTFSHRKSMGESDHLPKVHTTKVYEVDWDSPKQVESVRCCQPVPEKAKLQENIYNKYEYVSYLLRRLTLIH